jgi:hypothetical protein
MLTAAARGFQSVVAIRFLFGAGEAGAWVGRCYLGFAAFLTCAPLVFASTLPVPPVANAVLLAFALASADLALGACWAVPIGLAWLAIDPTRAINSFP